MNGTLISPEVDEFTKEFTGEMKEFKEQPSVGGSASQEVLIENKMKEEQTKQRINLLKKLGIKDERIDGPTSNATDDTDEALPSSNTDVYEEGDVI